MCYSAPEAAWLSRRSLDDLLLDYPCWHAEQVRAICLHLADCILQYDLVPADKDSNMQESRPAVSRPEHMLSVLTRRHE